MTRCFAPLLLFALALPAHAQELDASKLYLWSGGVPRCVGMSIGSGAPSGGVTCDQYLDYATGNVYQKIGGAWVRVLTGGDIGSTVQAYNAKLGTFSALADAAGWLHSSGAGVYAWSTPSASDVGAQAASARLTDIAALAVTDSNIIVGDGSTWVAESGATARTSLGLGTSDSPQFTHLTLEAVGSPVLTLRGSATGNPQLLFYQDAAVRGYLYYSSAQAVMAWNQTGTGAGGITVNATGDVGIGVALPATRLDIAGGGLHLVGGSVVVERASSAVSFDAITYASTNTYSLMRLMRSKSNTVGVHSAVVIGDKLGEWDFSGSDGSAFVPAVAIESTVDAAVSSGVVPGRLTIYTLDTTGAFLEALRITSSRLLVIGGAGIPSGTNGVVFPIGTALTSMASNTAGDGAVDVGGTVERYTINEANEVTRLTGLQSRVATQFDKTTDTTLANITGLTRNVAAGLTYDFTATLYIDADATGGSKFAVGGTATATAIIYSVVLTDEGTLANTITSRQTALGGAAGQAGTTAGVVTIRGTITVNVAGTLTIQFAQNASNGTSSVLVGSTFSIRQVG